MLGDNVAQKEVVVVQEEDEDGQHEASSQSVSALDVGDDSGADRVSVGEHNKHERFMDTLWEHVRETHAALHHRACC